MTNFLTLEVAQLRWGRTAQHQDEKAGAGTGSVHTLWLAGGLVILMCGSGSLAFGEQWAMDASTWFGLRAQSDPSVRPPAVPLDQHNTVLQQAPSLSGRFQVKEQTVIPFIGAGFGGGYTNDRDRALGSNGLFHNPSQSGISGRNMMPNEFNLGLRIPF